MDLLFGDVVVWKDLSNFISLWKACLPIYDLHEIVGKVSRDRQSRSLAQSHLLRGHLHLSFRERQVCLVNSWCREFMGQDAA